MRRQLNRPISSETLRLLQRMYNSSQYPQVRRRAQFLILYHYGKPMFYLIQLFSVTRQTLHNWLNAWEMKGVVGLYDQEGRGRKRTFTPEQEVQIYQWTKEMRQEMNGSGKPRLDIVLRQIYDSWGIQISKRTLQRILKRAGSRLSYLCQLTVS